MTVIAGFASGGRVWMGADSAAVGSDFYATTPRNSKLFRAGPLLIGFTYSWRMGQIIRHKVRAEPRRADEPVHDWLCTRFVDSIRAALKDNGFVWNEHHRESAGPFLVGCEGSLYEVCSEFDVLDYGPGPVAVGCGRDFALGALAAGAEHPRPLEPRKRLLAALRAAERYSAGVRRPFVIKSLEGR